MSKSQKLLIGCGALIIVAIVVIGAFSLGVYVGEKGWTAGPPSIVAPRGPPPPQGPRGGPGKQPSALGAVLPKDKPDLTGVVQSVAATSLTVRTQEGPHLVLVNGETRVERADGEKAGLADLRYQMPVAVFGDFGDDGRTLVARVIVLLPPRT